MTVPEALGLGADMTEELFGEFLKDSDWIG
jgi:hypothetical protein